MVSIICACKKLVDIIDGKVAEHPDCSMSGGKYAVKRRAPSQPGLEVVTMEGPCSECGEPGLAIAVRPTGGGPSFGTSNN